VADVKLFRLLDGSVEEIPGSSVALEKSLQTLIEKNLEAFLGVKFLATEHSTGSVHGGRIDTLGIDENACPVIIEYKRATNENVINQGLFYLDWLMDHRGDFEWLVLKKLGAEAAKAVEWSAPRLICIAGNFTKYDEHAVKQINRNIELIRYRRYGNDLFLFELVNQTSAQQPLAASQGSIGSVSSSKHKTPMELLENAPPEFVDRFESLKAALFAMGDDIQMKPLRYYIAFKRLKNFVSVVPWPQKGTMNVYLKVDPESIQLEKGFTRDVREIGHHGTGDLEVTLHKQEDLERALPLMQRSYEAS
jgi:predicted transport protein